MNKKYLLLAVVVLFSVVSGLLLGNLLARRADLSKLTDVFSRHGMHNKVDELLSIINNQYVDTVDVKEMTEELMTDLVSKLDQHSVYISASDLENVNSELEGSFSGIGVQFNIQNDTVMIVAVVVIVMGMIMAM